MRIFLSFILLLSFGHCFAQNDELPVVGVSKFSAEKESKFTGAVTQKVIEILTKSHRFRVLDRTSYDKVKEELELQKSESFIDSKNLADQNASLAAQFLVTGHIIKMNVYAMKNTDGSVNGYKASTSFQLKVNDVSKGDSDKAESFQTSVSPLMLSAESAVAEAVKSIDQALNEWVMTNFPVSVRLVKVLSSKKDGAESVLISGGKSFGLKVGDKFTVEKIELLDGLPYPTKIAELKLTKLAGDNFAECEVNKGGTELLSRFNAAEKIICTLNR